MARRRSGAAAGRPPRPAARRRAGLLPCTGRREVGATQLETFTGHVVAPASASTVVAPPYDALDRGQRQAIVRANPDSYLAALPAAADPDAAESTVLAACRSQLDRLLRAGHFEPLDGPALAVYRLRDGDHVQTGVVGDLDVAAFTDGTVRAHERTRPDRVAQLVRYLEVVEAASSPVCLTHRPDPVVDQAVAAVTAGRAHARFRSGDDVEQTLWPVTDPEAIGAIQRAVARIGRGYITDGHHRSAAVVRHAELHPPPAAPGRVLVALFATDQVRLRAFHRLLRGVTIGPDELTAALVARGLPVTPLAGPGLPAAARELVLVRAGRWLRVDARAHDDGALDLDLLSREVLRPVLGRDDDGEAIPATRDPATLDAGADTLGVALYPPALTQVLAVADAGGTMPPKATYFTPKARSGVFVISRAPPR